MLAFRYGLGWQDGRNGDMILTGTVVYAAVVWVVNLKLMLETKLRHSILFLLCVALSSLFDLSRHTHAHIRSFTIPNLVIILGSVAMFFVFIFFWEYLFGWTKVSAFARMYSIANDMFSNKNLPLVLLVIVVACLFRDFVFKT